MIKLVKYNETQTYMFPSGNIATPEVIANEFPAVKVFPHVLQISGNVCQAVMELASLRDRYNINELLSDDEAIKEIEAIINQPKSDNEYEPTPEERIAAALEFQNLQSL